MQSHDPSSGPARQQQVEASILALDDRRIRALLSADVPTLRQLVHPDLIYTHSTGRQDTFGSYIDAVETGRTTYKAISRSATRVVPVRCGGILEGIVDLDVRIQGVETTMRNRFMAFWLLDGDSDGRLLAWASTRLVAS
jgi:hypothetical protein